MQQSAPARRELLVVLACMLLGAGLRFRMFGSLGLTHFDEGIYALAGLWAVGPRGFAGLDPMVVPYAPPGFPFLIGATYFILGVADFAAILASTLCGVATIPIAAWIGRRTLGNGGGGAAALLAAVSTPHIAFSRKALTDVPFGLVWLVVIGLGGRYLERMSLGRGIALGLSVGLAQLFKYNGWLPGVLVAGAAAIGLLVNDDERRAWLVGRRLRLSPLLFGLVAVILAGLVYWPWFEFVQRHGGYGALLAHHRSYLGGASRWAPYWSQQQAQLVALSGGAGWGAATWILAWLGAAWTRAGGAMLITPSLRVSGPRIVAGLATGALALGGLAGLPWWVGLALTPYLLASRQPARRLLGCWWLGLSILTPFYHPYARLWIPLHLVGWLLVAALVVDSTSLALGAEVSLPGPSVRSRRGVAFALALAIGLGLLQRWTSPARPFPITDFFAPTSTLRELVASLPGRLGDAPPPSPLLVLGRRPISFYLLLQGRYDFRLVEDLDDVVRRPESWAIVDGGLLGADFRSTLPTPLQSRIDQTITERLDPVTRLDVSPGSALSDRAHAPVPLLLLRPTPPAHGAR